MQVVIINAAGTVTRNIDDFANTNGAITVATLPFTPALDDPVYILRRTGSVSIDPQAIRDAMKLAPTGGAPASGSVDEHLDDILTDTGTTLPTSIATSESNVRGADSRDLTNLAGAGWVTADNLVEAHNKLDILQQDIDNFENITVTKVSLPTFERPGSGSLAYEFFFNLKDSAGDPVDADGGGGGTVTLEATANGGVAGDRDSNLSSVTMTNIGTGRYRGIYNVSSAHALEGIHLSFVLVFRGLYSNFPPPRASRPLCRAHEPRRYSGLH